MDELIMILAVACVTVLWFAKSVCDKNEKLEKYNEDLRQDLHRERMARDEMFKANASLIEKNKSDE